MSLLRRCEGIQKHLTMDDRDYYEQMFERSFSWLLRIGVAFLAATVACILLSSCKTQYVPVPEYHYDYSHSTDTVRERDSIIKERETIIREADSALLARLGIELKEGQRAFLVLQRELERIRNEKQESKTDTIIKVDSLRVPYPVERPLTRWEKAKMDYGAVAMGGSGVAVIMAVVLLLRWLRRRDK